MKDNLFDRRATFLDFVKVVLLLASFFSTWHIISLITPPGPFAFVRIIAFLVVVEGGLVGLERAAMSAKNERQETLATIGYFCSLAVIGIFMLVSGFLELSGPALLTTVLGQWLSISWTVSEVVGIFALVTVASWVVGLATIARFLALADPDKQADIQRKKISGKMQTERNTAFGKAMEIGKGEIAIQSALLSIEKDYGSELTPNQLADMKRNVEASLRAEYQAPAAPAKPVSSPSPVARPVLQHPIIAVPAPVVAAPSNGNGQHHPTP